MSRRPIDVAQHEAAHIVVGTALGLRVRRAVLACVPLGSGWYEHGAVWFRDTPRESNEAHALMFAAGLAWDKAVRDPRENRADRAAVLELVSTHHGLETCVRAAGAMLAGLGVVHARVTRALLERDLCGRDVLAIAHGERLSDGE